MTAWQWVRAEQATLARYVTPLRAAEALGALPVPDGSTTYDALHHNEREMIVRAVYDAMRRRNISYSLEPVYHNPYVQLLRPPEVVLAPESPEGTCIDLALCFAGLCEHRYLIPIVVIFSDHAIAMVSTTDDYESTYTETEALFPGGICTHAAVLRGLVESGSHIAVECTGFAVSHSSADHRRHELGQLSYEEACADGRDALQSKELQFAILPTALHKAEVRAYETVDDEIGHVSIGSGPILRPIAEVVRTTADAEAVLRGGEGSQAAPAPIRARAQPFRRLEPMVLVTRATELEKLAAYLQSTSVAIVYVVGLAGIGKSQLARGAIELRGENVPAAWLSCAGLDVSRAIANIAEAIGLDPAIAATNAIDAAISALLDAARSPALVCFDGLEALLDNATGKLSAGFAQLFSALSEYEHGIKIVATTRRLPSEVHDGSVGVGVIRLGGLGPRESKLLVDHLIADDSGAEAVADSTFAALAGNPKFIELFAAALDDLPAQIVSADVGDVAGISEFIRGQIMTSLSGNELDILQAAVPFRDAFTLDSVEAVFRELNDDAALPKSALQSLVRRSVLDRGDDSSAYYLHPLLRDAVPRDPSVESSAHSAAAHWFLPPIVDATDVACWDDGLYHLRRAAELDSAAIEEYGLFITDNSRNFELAGWGRRMVEETRVAIDLEYFTYPLSAWVLGIGLWQIDEYEEAVGLFESLVEQPPDPTVELEDVEYLIRQKLVAVYIATDRRADALALANVTPEPPSDMAVQSRLRHAEMWFDIRREQMNHGESTADEKLEAAKRCLELAQEWMGEEATEQTMNAVAEAHFALGVSYMSAGDITEAIGHIRSQLALKLQTGNLPGIAAALGNLGTTTADPALLLVSDQISYGIGRQPGLLVTEEVLASHAAALSNNDVARKAAAASVAAISEGLLVYFEASLKRLAPSGQ